MSHPLLYAKDEQENINKKINIESKRNWKPNYGGCSVEFFK